MKFSPTADDHHTSGWHIFAFHFWRLKVFRLRFDECLLDLYGQGQREEPSNNNIETRREKKKKEISKEGHCNVRRKVTTVEKGDNHSSGYIEKWARLNPSCRNLPSVFFFFFPPSSLYLLIFSDDVLCSDVYIHTCVWISLCQLIIYMPYTGGTKGWRRR